MYQFRLVKLRDARHHRFSFSYKSTVIIRILGPVAQLG